MNWKMFKGIGNGLVISALLWAAIFQVARHTAPVTGAAFKRIYSRVAIILAQ